MAKKTAGIFGAMSDLFGKGFIEKGEKMPSALFGAGKSLKFPKARK